MPDSDFQGLVIPLWASEAEWHKARTTLPHGHSFVGDYAGYVQRCNAACALYRQRGVPAVLQRIDVDGLVEWCRQWGREVNNESTQAFAVSLYDDLQHRRPHR